MNWTSSEILQATGGNLIGAQDWSVSGITLDNRHTQDGDLFIALKGDNHDGHDYIEAAFDAGAAAALVSHAASSEKPQIVVKDTLPALVKLAEAARQRSAAKIIAITGSVGKTGTKHIISNCLSALGRTHASAGNFNNHIGAPISLALMPKESDHGVFELGMNHSGEIAALSPMVNPDIAVITRISNSHSGFFNSLDDIAAAKAEIFSGLVKGGIAVLNADDPYLDYLAEQARLHGASKIITCGYHENADAQLIKVNRHKNGLDIIARIAGDIIEFSMKMNASHWALSAVMALAVVDQIYPDNQTALKKAALAMADLEELKGRGMRQMATLDHGGMITLIDDSYNASPASMVSALSNLGQDPDQGRRVAILADMLELGDDAPDLHRGLLDAVMAASPSVLICFGPLMAHLANAYAATKPDCEIHHCDNANAAVETVKPLLKDGDLVLIKGSNGMKTSLVVSALQTSASDENKQNGGHHAA